MKIKFGVQHGINSTFANLKTEDYFKSIKFCEEMEYDSIFLFDHLNHIPLRAEIPSSMVLLTCTAMETDNIMFGSCVSDPHRRHPAQIALDSLTLQKISKNRFILGIGAGEGLNLTDFGILWNKPASRLIETVEVIKLLWKTSQSRKLTVDFSGEFLNLKNARLQFPTKILPKLWIAANGPRLIEFAGLVADGWIQNGHNPGLYKKNLEILGKARRLNEVEKACEVYVVISKDKPEKAKEIARRIGCSMCLNPLILDEYGIKIPEKLTIQHHLKLTLSEFLKTADKGREFVLRNVPENIIDSMVIAGTPENCIEQINNFIKAGVEHFLIAIFGLGNYFKATELFTNEVFNYFKEERGIVD